MGILPSLDLRFPRVPAAETAAALGGKMPATRGTALFSGPPSEL